MDSKQANRIRSNGIAQGCEDSRWMRARIAELEARERELADALKEREWQPIETAPKDGSEILGWSSISGEAYVMWWEAIHSDWVWCINDLEDMFCDPTHWMPLPEPPE